MSGDKRKTPRRGRRLVDVGPRSGAGVFRIISWSLIIVELLLLAMLQKGFSILPGDKVFPVVCQGLILVLPPLGMVASTASCLIGFTRSGFWWSVVPGLWHLLFWIWVLWRLKGG